MVIMNEKSALLVGVNLDQNDYEFNESMDELDKLCETLMIEQRFMIAQNRDQIDYNFYVGKGKVQ
jgi:GTP-binding protein HflX